MPRKISELFCPEERAETRKFLGAAANIPRQTATEIRMEAIVILI